MVTPTEVHKFDPVSYKEGEYKQICDAAQPATDFARMLDNAGVPNLLWGAHALALCGSVGSNLYTLGVRIISLSLVYSTNAH